MGRLRMHALLDAPSRDQQGDAFIGILDPRFDGQGNGRGDRVTPVYHGVLAQQDRLAVTSGLRATTLVAYDCVGRCWGRALFSGQFGDDLAGTPDLDLVRFDEPLDHRFEQLRRCPGGVRAAARMEGHVALLYPFGAERAQGREVLPQADGAHDTLGNAPQRAEDELPDETDDDH